MNQVFHLLKTQKRKTPEETWAWAEESPDPAPEHPKIATSYKTNPVVVLTGLNLKSRAPFWNPNRIIPRPDWNQNHQNHFLTYKKQRNIWNIWFVICGLCEINNCSALDDSQRRAASLGSATPLKHLSAARRSTTAEAPQLRAHRPKLTGAQQTQVGLV